MKPAASAIEGQAQVLGADQGVVDAAVDVGVAAVAPDDGERGRAPVEVVITRPEVHVQRNRVDEGGDPIILVAGAHQPDLGAHGVGRLRRVGIHAEQRDHLGTG